MSYWLRKSTLGRHPVVEMTADEHLALVGAWQKIFILVQIEESWDCVIQSYLELEQSWLTAALRSSVLNADGYDALHDERLCFARRLSNLLTACRAYLDQAPQRLGQDLSDASAVKLFDRMRRGAHAQDFGYRVMEGLRNHAQHFGQPVHGTSLDSRWTQAPEDEARRLVFSVTALINVAELVRSPKITAKLREELSGDLTQLDAPTLVRAYLEGLAVVHVGLRQHFEQSLVAWEAAVSSAIARYAASNDGNVLALQAVELAEDGTRVSATPIFSDMPRRLRSLMQRNGSLVNLRRRVITNAPKT